jgi:putative transposase
MLPDRHRPAHPGAHPAHARPIIIFVTVCTAQRKPLLANGTAHQLLLDSWHQASHWHVGRYVIMPDHVHLFCTTACDDALPLKNWVKYWKSLVTKNWPQAKEGMIWQTDFWDRQLRSDDSYAQKWDYVRANPVRHGLTPRPEDWPYQGEIQELRWD